MLDSPRICPQELKLTTMAWFRPRETDCPCNLSTGRAASIRRNPSRKILEDRLGKAIRENEAQELSHGVNDVSTTMIYTHVLNRGGKGVFSPADRM
jgi:hypothetical protein